MIGVPNFDPKPHLAPRALPKNFQMGAIGAAVLGAVLIGAGFAQSSLAARSAILVGMNYFTAVSFGSMAFAMAMTITLARWSRPLKRVAEGIMLFTPVIPVVFLVFMTAIGGIDLYEWHTHPDSVSGHKHIWLQQWPFILRNFASLTVLSILGLAYIRNSLRPDVLLCKQAGVELPGWVVSLAGSAEGSHADAVAKSMDTQRRLAPIGAIVYALTLTFYAFDVIMSLAPHWYANMFGGWFFASGIWSGMVWIGLLSLAFRKDLGIDKMVNAGTYHDLGKLVFGFSMIWAYMFFAQLLPIWYGNMTEEIGFLLVRMQLEPWSKLAPIVGAMCFLIPFGTLLSRGIKKMPVGLGLVLGIIAVGIFLERFIVAVPSVWMESTFPPVLPYIGSFLFFGGLLVLVAMTYLKSVPAVPVSDPFMLPHPDDIHVHSRDDHHGDHH
ncbi:MAG: hypothetical protein VX899_21110 [Myxococcota bacterium]|nr:hypothetical protein [Myxococcota bacterium]